jgi:hypothetical protein
MTACLENPRRSQHETFVTNANEHVVIPFHGVANFIGDRLGLPST